MLRDLTYFLKQSATYSIGNIAAKAVGVVLLPLYTSYISLADYGILAIIEVTLALSGELLSFGQGVSMIVLSSMTEYSARRKKLLFTVMVFLAGTTAAIGLPVALFADTVSSLFSLGAFAVYLRVGAIVVFLRVLNDLFMNKLRSEEQAGTYAAMSLSKLTVTLGFTVFFVVWQGLGILGILYAYAIGETLTLLLLAPRMIKLMEFSFDTPLLREALRFGAPLIVGSISGMILNTSDRYLLGLFQNKENVALYDLGYRVAGFLNMLLILPFNLALPPIASRKYQQPGDKRYFIKIMTYLTFVLVWAGLALSLFSRDLVRTFALNPSFWPAAQVVPLLVLTYVFTGMRYVAVLGLFLTKNTKHVALLVVGAAIISIASNIILIPRFGYIGAAFSSLGSFFLLLVATKYLSDRYYRIPFENSKLVKIVLIGVIFYVFSLWFVELPFLPGILLKAFLLVLFPAALFFWNFYEPVELQTLRQLFQRWNDIDYWRRQFQNLFK